jgi:uracil phosphoribosyltransferase
MLDGFSRMFDHSDQAFVSAYRRYINSEDFVVNVEYTSIPDIEERTIIILDPMIATGRSIVRCWEAIQREGAPKRVFVAAVIASEEGIETVQRRLPEADIFVGAVDAELTAKAYIIPGLGDAGDLAYGEKAR